MLDHFILTKFNLLLANQSNSKKNKAHIGINEDWLERRFSLFEKYCLPSVDNQIEKSFHWLIFFNHLTPKKFIKKIESLCQSYSYLTPIFDDYLREEPAIEEINKRSSPKNLRITTRLDNDDVIHPDYVKLIQKKARKMYKNKESMQDFFISFPLGYSLGKGRCYLQRFRYNPFVSFVSTQERQKTVIGWEHTSIPKVAPVKFQYTKPMWCQLIHKENISNQVRGVYWPLGSITSWLKK